MTEDNVISQSASVESQRIEGSPSGNNDAVNMPRNGFVTATGTESRSSSFGASEDGGNETQHSGTISASLPLNDEDDEFDVTDIVEQVLLFGCGLGSSLCCKFPRGFCFSRNQA